jgi:pilus assembly protein CpaE
VILGEYWRPLVLGASPPLRSSLLNVLRHRILVPEQQAVSEFGNIQTILDLVRTYETNVCFVDVSADEDQALAVIRELSARDLTVIALHTHSDSEVILRCVRCGVHEFLSEPFDRDSVWRILDELAGRRFKNVPEPRGSVYVVLPSKPSFGSTTVATGLASRAQRQGCRSVLLADLDALYGSIAFQLKLERQFTFLDAFSHWGRMDQDLWNQLLINYSGIDVLLGPETSGSGTSGLHWPESGEFLDFIRKRHSIGFLDCPGLFTDWYTQLASAADGVFLITTNEATAIQAARRSLERLEQFGCEAEKIKLVVNRFEPENGVAIKAIEAGLGRNVFHVLPSDREAMHIASLGGQPIGSDSRLGRSMDEMWKRLTRKSSPVKVKRTWRSALSFGRR